VPDWDNAQAGVIFEQLLTAADGKVDGVSRPTTAWATRPISVLKKNKLSCRSPGRTRPGRGLQNICAASSA
jgi:D-xylose transport system substrate-binding protein